MAGRWASSREELSALYAAFVRAQADPLPPLPVQYADYAAWQRTWVSGAVLDGQAAYWQERLAGAPEVLALPTDRPRPATQDYVGGVVRVELDRETTAALKALSQRQGTTLFMTVLAGWAAVLSRLSGQADVVVGTPTANRDRVEIEDLIGFFVNTLALRIAVGDAATVGDLLAQVKASAGGAGAPGRAVRARGGALQPQAESGAPSGVPGDVRVAECARAGRSSCQT